METLQINAIDEHIQIIYLDRPQLRNAINSTMMRELNELWEKWVPSQPNLRCLILTGSGDKSFCAGADLKERLGLDIDTWKSQHQILQQAMLGMSRCPIPIIAAVNGTAFGGGLELALACDFIYAANTATFSQSEVKLGLMPGAMGTQNLPRACTIRRAKELTFTGEVFTAQQAFEWGMVNNIFTLQNLINESLKTAHSIVENAPKSIRQVKKVINASTHLDINAGYRYEVSAYHELLLTKDRSEGICAFNEKRKPIFIDE
jgi:enoyl-CoA hydratase